MKKSAVIVIPLFCIFLAVSSVYAERSISLPYEMMFDGGDDWTADLAWTENGGSAAHLSSGCWRGGCVKLTPPTSVGGDMNGGMAAIGLFYGINTTRVNIRFLIKIGTAYYRSERDGSGEGFLGNKLIDVRSTSGTRFGILGFNPHFTTLEPIPNTDYRDFSVLTNPFNIHVHSPIQISDADHHGGKWICVEYEIDGDADTTTVYITEASGTTTITTAVSPNSGYMNNFYIGGYYNGYFVVDEDAYMLIDELKISDTYIGPPSGFIGTIGENGDNTGNESAGDCFIASAAFGSDCEPNVQILREFRDRILQRNRLGKTAISFYYRYSPTIAAYISKHEELRTLVRWILFPLVGLSWLALKVGLFSTIGIIMLAIFVVWAILTCLRKRCISESLRKKSISYANLN